PLSMNICVLDRESCERSSHCTVHPLWVELRDIVSKHLSRYSLKDLIE
ncbi:MAG: Rrf2 family transcriptional regulator, partial [Nitrospirae bacterium]